MLFWLLDACIFQGLDGFQQWDTELKTDIHRIKRKISFGCDRIMDLVGFGF
jgi:hypothetical protein